MKFTKKKTFIATAVAAVVSFTSASAFAGTLMCHGNTTTNPDQSLSFTGGTTNPISTNGSGAGYDKGQIGFVVGATPGTSCPPGYDDTGYAPTRDELLGLIDKQITESGLGGGAADPNAVRYNNGGTSANPGTVTVADGVNGKDATNLDQLNNGLSNTLNESKNYTDSKVTEGINIANDYTDSKTGDAINIANNYTDIKMGEAISIANEYTDIKFAEAIDISKEYTDEKTKYFQANSTGPGSVVTGQDSVAVGPGTIVAGDGAIGGGLNAIASGDNTVVFGSSAKGTASGAVAVGSGSQATASGATALGQGATAAADGAIALGNGSAASGEGAVALGNMSSAGAAGGIALGSGATASNVNDVALGAGSTTEAAVSTTGTKLNSTTYTFAGTAAQSTVSIGAAGAERTLTNLAAGRLSVASTDAVNGSQLHATNQAVVALGSTLASNNNGGLPPAVATGDNSVAIGPGSVADRDNTISFGRPGAERQLTNVAPAVAATDATNLEQVQSMIGGSVREVNAYTDQQIQALDTKTQQQLAGVGAMAMAASSVVPNARSEGNTHISLAAGGYAGASAIAAGVNHYVSNEVLLNAKVSATSQGPAKVGFAIGATFSF